MDPDDLVREYPVLFHMAADGAWPSIRAHGLRSTQALVDLFESPPAVRTAVLKEVRARSVILEHPAHGTAVVRDQRPLKFTDRLVEGSSVQQYLDALNNRVFFWLNKSRLIRLVNAQNYRKGPQTVIYVETARLIERHLEAVELAPYNTAACTSRKLPREARTSS